MIGTESGEDSSRVYSVGCSGVRVAGGDAHSLTPGHAYVTGNHIANFSLWKRTYMPGIFWNGAKAAFLLRQFILKTIILPRQARDKHRENSEKEMRCP